MTTEMETSLQDKADEVAYLRNALLVAGGIALVAYVAYRVLASDEENDSEDNPDKADNQSDTFAPVWTKVKGVVATYLVGMARERFSDVIAQFTQRTNAPSRTR